MFTFTPETNKIWTYDPGFTERKHWVFLYAWTHTKFSYSLSNFYMDFFYTQIG